MNQALIEELRKLRNEIRHGQRSPDADYLAKRLHDLHISVSAADLQWFVADLLRGIGGLGEYFVPPVVLDIVRCLLEGRAASCTCDPWAGLGVLAAVVNEVTHARKTFAFVLNRSAATLAKALTPQIDWHIGNPLALLETLTEPIDVIASVLPFGMQAGQAVELRSGSGEPVTCSGELGSVLVAAASVRLSSEGVGLFVVASSYFLSQHSVLNDLSRLGLGLEAAFALPAGSFAPFTTISTYLVVVRRHISDQMFVAQLSQDDHTNRQIVQNLRERKADGALELGRFVAPGDFQGFARLRLVEQLQQAERGFQARAICLGDLAEAIKLGRPGDEFEFPKAENTLYVPLIGISDVVDSLEEMGLKRQNYAQVVVDPARSDARFVARFLNSELGRAIREATKSGITIPKLNTNGLRELRIFVPSLETQKKTLEIAARVAAEQNTLLGLQNELTTLQRELWTSPGQSQDVDSRLRAFSARMASGATPHVAATLDQWFETLPFPLASILRAWQATESQDYKTKQEHLLHFFEACAEFLSVIYMSAFSSQAELFAGHREKLTEIWKKQNLSLQRATFGTWKVVVEYFSKQTRELLSGNTEQRTLCAELFADPTFILPEMLACKELAAVLSATNKARNDWGHGGVLSQQEARLRNEQLLFELQKLREAMSDGWRQVQLIRCLHCQPRRGVFDNEIEILVGSNSEFLKECRPMSSWLYVDQLYLTSREPRQALPLLPLMQIGPSPSSAKNACYFFNRMEKDGARFISYHFVEQPELKEHSDKTSAVIHFLTQVSPGDDN